MLDLWEVRFYFYWLSSDFASITVIGSRDDSEITLKPARVRLQALDLLVLVRAHVPRRG